MKFQGHLIGGIFSGSALIYGFVQFSQHNWIISPEIQFTSRITSGLDIGFYPVIFVMVVFMSLFPDLDAASIPQRWYFRSIFIFLLVIFFLKQVRYFIIVTFLSLLPVIHKHRGWTHWKITPWILSVLVIGMLEYSQGNDSSEYLTSLNKIKELLYLYYPVCMAIIIGHYTHLLLDSKIFSPLSKIN